jgi:MFS family permease
VLIALFGLTAGQAVVWYAGQFYALFFLEKVLRLDSGLAYAFTAGALLIGAPGFLLFGWLSDRIGRKPVILAGCALAALTYFPIFHGITRAANPALDAAAASSPVTVVADPHDCALQFDPVGATAFVSSCDIAKAYLAKVGVSYANQAAAPGAQAQVRIGAVAIDSPSGKGLSAAPFKARRVAFETRLAAALKAAGYPAKADPARIDPPKLLALLTLLVLYAAMVYGPMAAMLVEMFPTQVRYTSMSLPYHIGNGWFGGFLPTSAFAIVAATGGIYQGLWYPVIIAGAGAVIGLVFVRETKGAKIEKT